MVPVSGAKKPFLVENADPLLKLASAILGTIYVLGLLISNIQLMELGVADFASLQVRNIMTGFLFLIYALFLLLNLTPIVAAFFALRWMLDLRGWRTQSKVLAVAGVVITLVAVEMVTAMLAGTLLGYLYPGGRGWDQGYLFDRAAWTWGSMKSDVGRTLIQFRDFYQYRKVITAGLGGLYAGYLMFQRGRVQVAVVRWFGVAYCSCVGRFCW